MSKKNIFTLSRLARNMGRHLSKHPNDNATRKHAKKLGILADVEQHRKEAETADRGLQTEAAQ